MESLEARCLLSVSPLKGPSLGFAPADHAPALAAPPEFSGVLQQNRVSRSWEGEAPAEPHISPWIWTPASARREPRPPRITQGYLASFSARLRAAAFADDYGNTMAAACALALSSTNTASARGRIGTVRDVDMFSLVAAGDGTIAVTLSAPAGKRGVVPRLTLCDADGNTLTSSSGTSKRKTASSTMNVTAGSTYFIKAAGAKSTIGNYSLSVSASLTPEPVPPPPPPPEPDPSPQPAGFLPGPDAYSAASAVTWQRLDTQSGQVLVVLGTDAADTLVLSQSGGGIVVVTAMGSQNVDGSFAGIAVYGFGGDDSLRLDASVSLVSVIYAGAGNDAIYDAGPGASHLYGQDGDDTIVSVGGAADVLFGGAGLDSFWFDASDTLVDVQAAETAAKSVHKITAFVQPTTDPAKAVSLEIAGQDIVDPVAGAAYTNNFMNRPLWVDGPQYNDVRQGQVGDCYFLAGLSALADTDPGLLRQSIVALGDGTYAVRFFRSGAESYYRIDAQLPTSGSSPYYAKLSPSGELWVALLEKAFAQFRSGANSYSSIAAGWMREAYAAITSASYIRLAMSSSADTLAQSMADSLAGGNAVTAGSYSTQPTGSPIVGSHAYNVHAVTQENGAWYVTVYNPWGYDGKSYDGNPGDGLLRLTASQFQTFFSAVEVCLA